MAYSELNARGICLLFDFGYYLDLYGNFMELTVLIRSTCYLNMGCEASGSSLRENQVEGGNPLMYTPQSDFVNSPIGIG